MIFEHLVSARRYTLFPAERAGLEAIERLVAVHPPPLLASRSGHARPALGSHHHTLPVPLCGASASPA